jgi:hypothetical protein
MFLKNLFVLGKIGGGKSKLLTVLSVAAQEVNHRRIEAGEDLIPLTEIFINNKKGGDQSDLPQDYADLAASRGLPPAIATSVVYRPGVEGARFYLDIADPGSGTAAEQVARLALSISTNIGTAQQLDGNSERALLRYLKSGGQRMYIEAGYDLDTDAPEDPYLLDGPAPPRSRQISYYVHEAIEKMKYDGEVRGNISEYVGGTAESAHELIAGRVLDGGNPIDPQLLIGVPRVDIELDRLTDNPTSRRVVITALIQMVEREVLARYKRLGIVGPVKELVVLFGMDETDLFNLSPAGVMLTDFLTRLRSAGIGFMLAKTANIAEVDDNATGNMEAMIAFGLANEGDGKHVQRFSGGTMTDRQVGYLASSEIRTHPGRAVAIVPGGTGPFLVDIDRVDNLPRKGTVLRDARSIAKPSPSGLHYEGAATIYGERFLRETQIGGALNRWIDYSVFSILTGFGPVPITGELLEKSRALTHNDAIGRDAGVNIASTHQVDARKAVRYVSTRAAFSERVAQNAHAQLEGTATHDVKDWVDLALPGFRLNGARQELLAVGVLTAPRLAETEEYAEAWGGGDQNLMGGLTAREQQHNLVHMERRSLQTLATVIASAEGYTPSEDDFRAVEASFRQRKEERIKMRVAQKLQTMKVADFLRDSVESALRERYTEEVESEMVSEMARELPIMPPQYRAVGVLEFARQVRGAEDMVAAVVDLQANIEAAQGRKLTAAQQHAFDVLSVDVLSGQGPAVGFPEVRRKLAGAIKSHKENAPGIPMREWSERLGINIPEPTPDIPVMARDQLEFLNVAQADEIAQSPFMAKLDMRREAWVQDRLRGGYTMDRIAEQELRLRLDQMPVLRQQREDLNGGAPVDYTYAAILRRGDAEAANLWVQIVREFLYDENFNVSPELTDLWVGLFDGVMQAMRAQDEQDKAKRAQSGQAA